MTLCVDVRGSEQLFVMRQVKCVNAASGVTYSKLLFLFVVAWSSFKCFANIGVEGNGISLEKEEGER